MKKFFAIAMAVVVLLAFTACQEPEAESTLAEPRLTIRNQSTFTLTNVDFAGIDFGTLAAGAETFRPIPANLQNQASHFAFNRVSGDVSIRLRTDAARTVGEQGYTFSIINQTPVHEVEDTSNTGQLGSIYFRPRIAIVYDGNELTRGDIINIGHTFIDTPMQVEFIIRNTGRGTVTPRGGTPVSLEGGAGTFRVTEQPQGAIVPNGERRFRIDFTPQELRDYSAIVTVAYAAEGEFSFTVAASGVAPRPVAVIIHNDNPISQGGYINVGEVLVPMSRNITVTIRNEGQAALTMDLLNIRIEGIDTDAFSITSNPGPVVQPGGTTSFVIQFSPQREGENNAVLRIPTNDDFRNPIEIHLRVTGARGTPILELSQASTIIDNNSLTPVAFGQVILGSNTPLSFTIRNTGDIPLELTGNPMVESSNPVFTVSTQPASGTVTPGGSVQFVIRYEPTSEGEDISTVTIFSNSTGSSQFTFTVRGNGYERRPQVTMRHGALVINPHGVSDFGTIATGRTGEVTFTIENSGEANLNIEAVSGNRINLEGNAAGFFSIAHQPATGVVTPGSTTTFAIRFSPTTVGTNFTAMVRVITDSRYDGEFTFTVTGDARATSSEARLSGLEFSHGTLSPAFDLNIHTYDLRIAPGHSPITTKPVSMNANVSSIIVNGMSLGTGEVSQNIFPETTNTVTIEVTAEDGTSTVSYTINIRIVRTWERRHGEPSRNFGIIRAVSNGQGGIYAGGSAGQNTVALFNIGPNGDLLNTFTFPAADGISGPRGMGAAFNEFVSVFEAADESGDYFITRTTSPSIRPDTIRTSLYFNDHRIHMFPGGIARSGTGFYFVAGDAFYVARPSDTEFTTGVFVNRHFNTGEWSAGMVLELNVPGITAGSFWVLGMTLLTNGDVLVYGQAERSGRAVAFAAAIDVSNANSGLWRQRWATTYEIPNRVTFFDDHFWDNQSNLILMGGSDEGGFVVRIPGNTTAGTAHAGFPRVIPGGRFSSGLALSDGSGYLFVGGGSGSHGAGDAWVVMTDLNVNVIWENFFGGVGDDWFGAVVEIPDGFMLAGITRSPNIAGQPMIGTADIYILRINRDGTLD